MSSSQLRADVAAMRAAMAALGARLAAEAPRMSADELFEVTGDLQGVVNAAEGAQLVATAHAAAHETRLTDRGPVEVHHGLGFVDAMAPSEVSLATGTGQWAAGGGCRWPPRWPSGSRACWSVVEGTWAAAHGAEGRLRVRRPRPSTRAPPSRRC